MECFNFLHRESYLLSCASCHEVDDILFLLHSLDILCETGVFALVVRALETKQFCQTCAVGVVFNHAKFDAKINKENSVKSENVLSSQLASWSELKRANIDDKISNEEFRRRGLVDIAEKIREARLWMVWTRNKKR